MLEDISRAISTALFFLCTAIVGGLEPAAPALTDVPNQAIVEETHNETAAKSEISLVGRWNSGGRMFEFTASGKLLYGDNVMKYTKNGDTLSIIAEVNGQRREYNVPLEIVGERLIKIGGVTFYKTD